MIIGTFIPAGRTASTARIRKSALPWVGFAYVRGGVAFMFSIVVTCDRVSTGRGVGVEVSLVIPMVVFLQCWRVVFGMSQGNFFL